MPKRKYTIVKIKAPFDESLTAKQNQKMEELGCSIMLNTWIYKNEWENLKHHFMIQCMLTLEKDDLSMRKKIELIKEKYQETSEACYQAYQKKITGPTDYSIIK